MRLCFASFGCECSAAARKHAGNGAAIIHFLSICRFPERARLVRPWPLKTSHLNTASFQYLRNGPVVLWFLHLFLLFFSRFSVIDFQGHFQYSRIPPVENGPFRLDFFRLESSGPSSYRQSSRFYSFELFLEAVGVREYCCMAVKIGWQLCASRFLREQRLDEPSSQRLSGFGLSRKAPKLRSWSCTQPRAAKATAGAAVVGSMGSIHRAPAVV